MNKALWLVIIGAAAIGLIMLAGNQAGPEQNGEENGEPVVENGDRIAPEQTPATMAAQAMAAQVAGVDESEVEVIAAEIRQWPDGCMGLAGADEMCAQAIVDGYRIEVIAGGEVMFFRTDEAGSTIRQE